MEGPLLIDSHCHLADCVFSGRVPSVIEAAKTAGVALFIVPATAPAEWHSLQALRGLHPEIFPAYGLHPMHARQFSENTIAKLRELGHAAVAIGEIGLDYSLAVPRALQMNAFRRQLMLARELDLPVLIHCRKAFQDLLTILREIGAERVRGVMHAFSGSTETAVDCIKAGLHISLAGTVTFPNAVRPVKAAREVPLDHLLLESDAPDLSPEPYRGRPNEPAFLTATACKVAEIKGVAVEEVAARTWKNAVELFRLPISFQAI
ncbi:TatD family hydrolase [Geotalea sp. SG265]|uniref:TatD family hydrolase n=1 Tax=Geotalea sp. SG265 TaxID=2922867 RepID=UPI001FAF8F9B|nr:TatD family hydrolase [Geotalea sp. SG265]